MAARSLPRTSTPESRKKWSGCGGRFSRPTSNWWRATLRTCRRFLFCPPSTPPLVFELHLNSLPPPLKNWQVSSLWQNLDRANLSVRALRGVVEESLVCPITSEVCSSSRESKWLTPHTLILLFSLRAALCGSWFVLSGGFFFFFCFLFLNFCARHHQWSFPAGTFTSAARSSCGFVTTTRTQ